DLYVATTSRKPHGPQPVPRRTAVSYRRRPERFFFLRGEGGGGLRGRPSPPSPEPLSEAPSPEATRARRGALLPARSETAAACAARAGFGEARPTPPTPAGAAAGSCGGSMCRMRSGLTKVLHIGVLQESDYMAL